MIGTGRFLPGVEHGIDSDCRFVRAAPLFASTTSAATTAAPARARCRCIAVGTGGGVRSACGRARIGVHHCIGDRLSGWATATTWLSCALFTRFAFGPTLTAPVPITALTVTAFTAAPTTGAFGFRRFDYGRWGRGGLVAAGEPADDALEQADFGRSGDDRH